MANKVTIPVTTPGAKEAAGQFGALKAQITGMGSAKAGPLGGMTAGFGGAGLAMLGAVGAGVAIGSVLTDVGGFLGDAAVAAMDEEKSVKSLTTALEKNVPAWDGSMAAIDRVTQAGIDLGITDDETRAGIQKFVIANGDLEKSLGLATLAFDVARGTGKSYAEAVDIVNKASIGNSKALKLMGIDLGKAATATELLGALTERFGGQAIAYTQTLSGKVEVANTKFGEMEETIGNAVMPAIGGFADYTADTLIPGLGNLANAVGDIFNPLAPAQRQAEQDTQKWLGTVEAMAGEAAHYAGTLEDETQQSVNKGFTRPTLAELARMREEAGRSAHAAGIQITDDLAGALSGNKDVVTTAMDKVTFAINHPMQQTRELARIEGALTSSKLAEGLNSTNPAVRAIAREQQQILLGQWSSITGSAYGYGRDAAQQWVSGLGSVSFHVRDPFKDPGRDPGHKGPGGRASGGDVAPGETVVVGEQGKELWTAGPGGAHVTPNNKLGNGGGTINVNVSLSTREFARGSRHNSVIQAGGPSF